MGTSIAACVLSAVLSAGPVYEVPKSNVHWWARYLKCRTLVRYGDCRACQGGMCPAHGHGNTFDYRVQFDYPWYVNRKHPGRPWPGHTAMPTAPAAYAAPAEPVIAPPGEALPAIEGE